MTISHDVNDLLEGGGTALKYPTIGTTHKGTVISATTSQATDLDRKPKYWDDGNPVMQVVVTLQTDYRDDPSDDGVRRLFIQSGMIKAVKAALQAANSKLETGGMLAVQYSGNGTARPGFQPPKQYQAQYRPPAPTTTANDLLGTPTSHATAATWAEDGGTPRPAVAEAKADFDPLGSSDFMDK